MRNTLLGLSAATLLLTGCARDETAAKAQADAQQALAKVEVLTARVNDLEARVQALDAEGEQSTN